MKSLTYSETKDIKLIDGGIIPIADIDDGTFLRPFMILRSDGDYEFYMSVISNIHNLNNNCIINERLDSDDRMFTQLKTFLIENYGISSSVIRFSNAVEKFFKRKIKKPGD